MMIDGVLVKNSNRAGDNGGEPACIWLVYQWQAFSDGNEGRCYVEGIPA